MRAFTAIAIVAFGLAGSAGVQAADMRAAPNSFAYDGVRADPYLLFDVEPGIIVRPYWLPGWQGRTYFPATGIKPRVGRRENLAQRGRYVPAKSYRRSWSTSSAFWMEEVGPAPGYVEPKLK